MTVTRVRASVEGALRACRDSLARLEDEFGAAEDSEAPPADLGRIQDLVVAYATLVAGLREYLEQERMGRRQPARLASRLEAFAKSAEAAGGPHGLHPTVEEAAELASLARGVGPRPD